jgi:hypothetical protein
MMFTYKRKIMNYITYIITYNIYSRDENTFLLLAYLPSCFNVRYSSNRHLGHIYEWEFPSISFRRSITTKINNL